jgi:hypothetical protein
MRGTMISWSLIQVCAPVIDFRASVWARYPRFLVLDQSPIDSFAALRYSAARMWRGEDNCFTARFIAWAVV